jgi:CubicO group peptidase (beta-lactamase class C family)
MQDSILRSNSGRRSVRDQERHRARPAETAGGDGAPPGRRPVAVKAGNRKKSVWVTLAGLLSILTLCAAEQNVTADMNISEVLEPILRAHNLPAMAGAIVTGKGLASIGAVGVRKAGTDIAVTVADGWHLGSDTKTMTAAMIGALVEKGNLTWETTIEQVFADQARPLAPVLQKVTLLQLLSHRSGLPANILWNVVPKTIPTREQRHFVLKSLASVKLLAEPGAEYLYSNLGYVIAAAMAETAADESWENLMTKMIFEPLGMTSVGYGGLGTPGHVDQPWAHLPNGKPVAGNGPDWDNPPVMGPAGRVHCTLGDWAKFITDQLRGARGEKALLKTETYRKLQTPPFGGDCALGWLVVERSWGGGMVLTHAGSNTMNFAVVWAAPLRDFAVLVVTNQGGPAAAKACDEAAAAMIGLYQKDEDRHSLSPARPGRSSCPSS